MDTDHSFAHDLGFLLSRASGVVARSASEALAPLGLRVRSYSVLAFAAEQDPGAPQRSLAQTMALDPSQVVALVDELEQQGFVTRTPDPGDRRNKLVTATADGHRVLRRARRVVRRAEDEHFAELPQQQVEELRHVLRQVAFGPLGERPSR